jgi:hypothetical protein
MIYDKVWSGGWYVLFGKSEFLHVQEICLRLKGRNVFKWTLKTEGKIYSEADEEKGMVSQTTTVIFGGAFYLG